MEVIKIFDEKFKIRVSAFLRQTLEMDAVAFNFIKRNGEANLNAYLNKLIPNLLELKKERRNDVLNYAKQEFGIKSANHQNAEAIITGLNTIFERIYFSDVELDDLSQTIWIRPTKDNISVFDEILDSETEITSLEPSVYIRNLLNEYSRFPRYKKEQIAFAQECDITLSARESGRILKFRYEGVIHRAFVFGCVYNYLEEQGNYFLCYDIGVQIICRYQISEVFALHLLDQKFKPDPHLSTLCFQYMDDGLWIDDEIINLRGDN